MKNVFIISCLLTLLFHCQSAKPNKPPISPDKENSQGEDAMVFPKTVEEYLGSATIAAIQKAESGESMTVASRKSQSGSLLAGYPILAKGRTLSKDQVQLFKKLLLDPKSYVFPTAKKVMIAPKYGILLGDVVVLIDPANLLISVPSDGKSKIEDYDPIQAKIQALLKELF
ncbi:hypothetical protein [Leptospira idonii]|uniref:Uncharacterized protein n=1 Tax=Leptospira idonii TaxID=1193500 RepID=A0A4R9M778_9LEPT|nr:hypothetical protein [Leptospira idonii]TGN20969.1 hypothetical protein EHS15_00145 [Leptospira idonii]